MEPDRLPDIPPLTDAGTQGVPSRAFDNGGCRMQTPCARFPSPGPPARSSVLGIRPSASIGSQVPGTRHLPGTWHPCPILTFQILITEGDALERYPEPEPSASAIGDAKRKQLIDKVTPGL